MKYVKTHDIRSALQDELVHSRFVTDKSGVKTIELIGVSFIADEPSIFGTVNMDYVERELEWYKSMSLNVEDIPGETPAIWKAVADADGMINSNYGWAIWSQDNYNQYEHVLAELKKNPDSRRAVMIYTRPNMWNDYNHNGRSDFMCTNAVQYLIRNGKLNAIVQMRSNDAVFGYKNDRAWQDHVQQSLADDLGVKKGKLIWQVGSLHVYERHFNLVT